MLFQMLTLRAENSAFVDHSKICDWEVCVYCLWL